jgi:hypothetical protein
MICRHLRDGSDLGYFRVEVPPGVEFDETGLCEECDRLFFAEGSWTMRRFDFADGKLVLPQVLRAGPEATPAARSRATRSQRRDRC